LRPVRADAASTELKLLTEHRDDLVRTRTQTVNRLHAIMTLLVIGGAPRSLTADTAATLLRRVHPAESVTMTRRLIAVDLVAEIRRLDKRISTATEHITTRVTSTESTLTVIPGIGELTAGKILARTGPVTRFANEAHFAAYAGVAPREVSSGDVIRHRLNRGGDRQLNYALHVIALTQISMKSSPGRVFYDRKRTEGKSGKEALRALKRRLATVVFRILLADHARVAVGPAGQSGTTLKSSATGSHPDTSSSDKSLTGPTTKELIYVTPRPERRLRGHGGIKPLPRRRDHRHLTATEREEVSRGIAAGRSIRTIAASLRRPHSTISREIARNGGRSAYRAGAADLAATARSKRPKVTRLRERPVLLRVVKAKIALDWSPEQIAAWLKLTYPGDVTMRLSHEAIYRSIYYEYRRELDRGTAQHLRSGRTIRRPRRGK
jgi:DNA-binding NarL/FixJ family response regulator